jgi:hypothetical protein
MNTGHSNADKSMFFKWFETFKNWPSFQSPFSFGTSFRRLSAVHLSSPAFKNLNVRKSENTPGSLMLLVLGYPFLEYNFFG